MSVFSNLELTKAQYIWRQKCKGICENYVLGSDKCPIVNVYLASKSLDLNKNRTQKGYSLCRASICGNCFHLFWALYCWLWTCFCLLRNLRRSTSSNSYILKVNYRNKRETLIWAKLNSNFKETRNVNTLWIQNCTVQFLRIGQWVRGECNFVIQQQK